jgi:hypothetical protein
LVLLVLQAKLVLLAQLDISVQLESLVLLVLQAKLVLLVFVVQPDRQDRLG